MFDKPIAKAFATYTFQARSIIVHLEVPNGDFRSFRLDRGRRESKDSLYSRAYSEADRWATERNARLESFRAV